jgi:hypothetical protein
VAKVSLHPDRQFILKIIKASLAGAVQLELHLIGVSIKAAGFTKIALFFTANEEACCGSYSLLKSVRKSVARSGTRPVGSHN